VFSINHYENEFRTATWNVNEDYISRCYL